MFQINKVKQNYFKKYFKKSARLFKSSGFSCGYAYDKLDESSNFFSFLPSHFDCACNGIFKCFYL